MHACFVVFGLVLSCAVIVISLCCRHWHNNINEPFWVAAEQKGGQVVVNISLAFPHWIRITLHP